MVNLSYAANKTNKNPKGLYCKGRSKDRNLQAVLSFAAQMDGHPHAHIMLTMRPFTEEKTWGDKQKKEYTLDPQGNKIYDPKKRQYKCKSVPTTDWNEQTKAEDWRAARH